MAKAVTANMNYYETLIDKMERSMKANPRSAMVMDMTSFEIVAKGSNFKSLKKKLENGKPRTATVVFQKPNQKAAWIL